MFKKNLFTSTCILFYTIFLLTAPAAAESFQKQELNTADYSAEVYYPGSIQPGDPFFVILKLKPVKKFTSALKKSATDTSLSYWSNAEPEKKLRTSQLYLINGQDKKRNQDIYIGSVPTSTYLATADYRTTLSFKAWNKYDGNAEFTFTVLPKEFVNETIPLNSQNTAIRTDDSEERKLQIERLNKVLGTVNPSATYENDGFIFPTEATRRTSFFGDRRIFAYSNGKKSTSLHYGIDWGVPTGSTVGACGKGKVVLAENRITTGWSICIEHQPGLYSLYYHMSELKVKTGDIVEKGQLIGLSGATGLATGPHIHWEVRLFMEAVNPDWFVENSLTCF